jgi:hypothetical protein
MSLVFNERTKLTASWFNTLATALIAAGAFAPVAASLYGLSAIAVDGVFVAILATSCSGIGVGLHLLGVLLLGRLRE